MNGLLMKAGLGTVIAVTTLAAAAPADAQRWRGRGYDRGGDVAAGALIGGVIGLGLGAAIASDRGRGYDRGYYDDRGYYGPPPRAYYRQRYYRPRNFYPRRNFYRGYGYPPPPYGYYRGW
jgi:hypothetical protein